MTVALITGASKGIGLATTRRLAEENCTVYATARHPEQAAQLLELAEKYKNVSVIQLDVTDPEEVVFEKIKSLGPIDILINNAGVGLYGPVETATEDQEKEVFAVNYHGALKVTRAVLPSMRERNEGKIITLSSIAGLLTSGTSPIYGASKAAINSVMRGLRADMKAAKLNIKVCTVAPGPVATEFADSTYVGERFSADETPYTSMESGLEKWRQGINQGCSPEGTVNTILKVIAEEDPSFWNCTESRVREQVERVYHDGSGESYIVVPFTRPPSPILSFGGTIFPKPIADASQITSSTSMENGST